MGKGRNPLSACGLADMDQEPAEALFRHSDHGENQLAEKALSEAETAAASLRVIALRRQGKSGRTHFLSRLTHCFYFCKFLERSSKNDSSQKKTMTYSSKSGKITACEVILPPHSLKRAGSSSPLLSGPMKDPVPRASLPQAHSSARRISACAGRLPASEKSPEPPPPCANHH